jgi:hypothetical protein
MFPRLGCLKASSPFQRAMKNFSGGERSKSSQSFFEAFFADARYCNTDYSKNSSKNRI